MPVDDNTRANAWDVYHSSQDSGSLQTGLAGIKGLSDDQRATLWDHWHANQLKQAAAPKTQPSTSIGEEVGTRAAGAGQGLYSYLANKGVSGVAGDIGDELSAAGQGVMNFARKARDAYSYALTDPEGRSQALHTFLPLGGQVAGAALTPESPIQGGAEGAMLGESTSQLYDALALGKVSPSGATDVGLAGAGGALGEVIPRIPNFFRPEITAGGRKVLDLYKNSALPHQLAESSGLDFLYNIAESGMTGESRIAAQQAAQRGAEAGAMRGITQYMHPSGGTGDAAQQVRLEAGRLFDQAQQPLQAGYRTWLQRFGQLQEVGPQGQAGASVAQLHAARSDALEQGRDALMRGDGKAAFEANRAADSYLGRMQNLLPQAAQQSYDALGGQYRAVMERYDNPLMRMLRKGVNPEQIADVMLNPNVKFPELTSQPGAKVSQTVPEMMQRMQDALSPEAWQQLKAVTAQRMYEKALSPTADPDLFQLDPMKLKSQVQRMGPGAFQQLFGTTGTGGPAVSADELTKFIDATSYAHKATGNTGKFFIALRQAAAMSAVGTATAGVVLGEGGDKSKALTAGGAAAAGTYIVAPWALARLMTNPSTRSLFIRGLEETNPTIKAQIMQGLNKMIGGVATAAPAFAAQQFKSAPAPLPNPPARPAK